MEWFEEWFDSPLYEKLYAYRDDAEAELLANNLESVLPLGEYHKILDLGCGRGRHSINMARRGYKVTGIDLSEAAIQKAKKRSKNLGLDIEFLIGDMRIPLERKFDAIINVFTSFGYFEDDDENVKVLSAMRYMLHPESKLVMDYLNANQVIRAYVPHERGKTDDISYEITRFIEQGTINKKMEFFLGEPSKKMVYKERVKLFDLNWFEKHMEEIGIRIIQTYGDYDFGEYNQMESPRLIIIGEVVR